MIFKDAVTRVQRLCEYCTKRDTGGLTSALWSAAEHGHYQFVELLIQSGADENGQDYLRYHHTALMIAVARGHD